MLALRTQALEPILSERADQESYDIAMRHIDAARRIDYMYSVMARVFAGNELPGDSSIRDRYMADSVHWHREHLEAGTKLVLMAHNKHIQKTPVGHGGRFSALPMGYYLARELCRHHAHRPAPATAAKVAWEAVSATSANYPRVDAPFLTLFV